MSNGEEGRGSHREGPLVFGLRKRDVKEPGGEGGKKKGPRAKSAGVDAMMMQLICDWCDIFIS